MAWRSGSLSRSVISTAMRAPSSSSSIRASPSISSIPRSPFRSPNLSSRRSLFSIPRNVAALGCAQSLMPLHSAVAAAQRGGRRSSHCPHFYRNARFLRVVSGYLTRVFG